MLPSRAASLAVLSARRLCGGVSRALAATGGASIGSSTAAVNGALGSNSMLRALGGHHAGFRSSAALWMPERLTIVVPSMGDSISEGTICAVLRQAGEAVEEDEVIAQIETDKVTVDVRAPKMGVIHNMLVREDETVAIGQTVALLEPSEVGAVAAAPTQSATPDEPTASPSPAGRKPSIYFPPRVTPDGRRVSDLPAEEARAFLASVGSEKAETVAAPKKPAAPRPDSDAPPKKPAVPAGKRTTVTDTAAGVPERYPYSEKEMECIMLGGAGEVDVNVTVS
eukprot:CAMPEP_0177778700 /NCGR_PEP_ID=MMETSP0491_2-20121128/16112_1 /TAXON_ID=63592 /ORGANISM="Tetraselmis chuii, Strain PLY429" /LENGTH=281 /DNA_ID=CAMNT_0019298027 /DNA_START=157 /DNA_END=999 /DNA_ORIENTATION=-